jgi:hypothetical protein
MELAESITGYAPLPKPDRFERDNQNKIGPEWHVPQSRRRNGWDPRLVRVVEGESGVFVEGGAYMWGGDMEAMTTTEARSLAMALLAAADWSDGQDVLGQRRARQAGTP